MTFNLSAYKGDYITGKRRAKSEYPYCSQLASGANWSFRGSRGDFRHPPGGLTLPVFQRLSEHGEFDDAEGRSPVRPIGNCQSHEPAGSGRQFIELGVPRNFILSLVEERGVFLAILGCLYFVAERGLLYLHHGLLEPQHSPASNRIVYNEAFDSHSRQPGKICAPACVVNPHRSVGF